MQAVGSGDARPTWPEKDPTPTYLYFFNAFMSNFW
jgi:hypothetical protein